MSKRVLGLDLGSNSLGWALLEEKDGKTQKFIDIGVRIFSKAVEEKAPTPKNIKRRDMRLGRRVLQRRARRKQRMLNYLVALDLLPKELQGNPQPEAPLNKIGCPYELRAKAIDHPLSPHELGRILLHFVARRGFLSSKKQLAGDLIDDPDTIVYLNEIDSRPTGDKEESAFKADINEVRSAIVESGYRTLGEYLHHLGKENCKRNRSHEGGHLRTDRKMYQDELALIWKQQSRHFNYLPDDFMQDKRGVKQIIFYQRPLKLKKDRVGKCSLEPNNYRAATARLQVQRFRYLQDINNLQYFERHTDKWLHLSPEDRARLVNHFENNPRITITALRRLLSFDKKVKFNLEMKDLKGNITACEMRSVLNKHWDNYSDDEQKKLVDDLLSIKKKSALKKRLINHWNFDTETAIKLCLLEFEPSHSNLSLKAINKLLPHLENSLIFSDARQEAGYGYETKEIKPQEVLGKPPETSNPIVNRGLHELKRVANAIIKEYGKLDTVRIEMARDLEMNTKRYKEYASRQNKNKKANDRATEEYRKLNLGKYPSHDDKLKYRLWEDQNHFCAYSCKPIPLNAVFTANVEIDHILPYKKSLDNSYMNKVLCYTAENRDKGDRTPKDAWDGNEEKWNQITQMISGWKGLDSKVKRFYQTEDQLQKRDFISTQLNDTRYISRLAIEYLRQLGCDVSTSKGATTAWLRHQWGLNTLIGETDKKERTDHRHHAIDAAVVACVNRNLYKKILAWTKNDVKELKVVAPYPDFRNELQEYLRHVIISHATNRKLSGALHEETGAGFIDKHGGLVYRKMLAPDFTIKNANSIVDTTIKSRVLSHLARYRNDPKKAFAEGITVYHKDNKTPIKRVRVLQSKTSLKQLENNKLPMKDKTGKTFKWMSYGNMHHVEIIQHSETGKIKGAFVTMMEAHRRAMTGTRSAKKRNIAYEPIIQKNHGEWNFLMALHINDMVSITTENNRISYYRIQKLGGGYDLTLRLHTETSTKREKYLIESKKMLEDSFSNFIAKYDLKAHKVNTIGIPNHD